MIAILERIPTPILVRFGMAAVFWVVIVTCGVWSSLINDEIIEKVNALLPENERFRPLFWGPSKRERLSREYRRLFPDGNDLKRRNKLTAIMFVATLCVALCLFL